MSETSSNILIVEDDPMTSRLLSDILGRTGYQATVACSIQEGLASAQGEDYDLILLDVGLPDGSGLDALPQFVSTHSAPEVIIITGAGDSNGAELAIRTGAWDYVQKPLSREIIGLTVSRALQYRKSRRIHTSGLLALNLEGFIGKTPKMREVFDLIAKAATTDANVLIVGETGSGKELVAQAIHSNSQRASKSFVVLDCSALPETLVDSVLFGHEKGAFTSADRPREGIIRQADKGTLFLDEVGELPLSVQKSFLRVLQERRFRPVGGKGEVKSDFRLVAATNRDPKAMVKAGTFREDLLYRLNTFTIRVPALRDRRADVKELVTYRVSRLCERYGIGSKGLSPDFVNILESYLWPGNVRELFHVLERAIAVAGHEPVLFSKHLPDAMRVASAQASLGKTPVIGNGPMPPQDAPAGYPRLKEYRESMDRQYLQGLMAVSHGDIKEACRISGLSQSRLYELIKIHNISS
ncbi:MAG: sigma-54-dependent transcriptional regulator [Syntrophobacteraceae bacterium]